MEARPYARLSVGALALRFAMAMPSPSTESSSATSRNSSLSPSSSSSSSTAAMAMAAAAATANHQDPSPSSSPYFCKVKLSHFKSQTVSLPVLPNSAKSPEADLNQASFYLDDAAIAKLHSSSIFCRPPYLCITVYRTEKKAMGTCYRRGSSTMGRFLVAMEAEIVNRNGGKQICHGWVKLGKKGSRRSWCAELHVCVRVDLDPRYIFQFDGQPERNPQIVQIQGNIRQPIFSCKFTCDRSFRTM